MATTYTLVSNKKSTYGSPYAYYTFTAVETSRSASSVTIKFTCTGKLATSSSYFATGKGLKAGVYIGGAWKTWTLKSTSSTWSGTSTHSVSASFSISAKYNVTSLSGIKVRVLRTDSTGSSCQLNACTPTKSSISIANTSSYRITYNANGGTGAPSTGVKDYNVTAKISTTIPTRASEVDDDGVTITYQFNGWSGNDGKTYQPGASYTTNKDLALTAIWGESGRYIVSYDCGEYSITQLADQIKSEGVALTLHSTAPTPINGFTFTNWSGSDGNIYNPGASYTTNANLSLSANYSVWSHTLKFNLNGGTASITFSNITVTTLNPAYIPYEEPVKDGYEFQYWCTTSDGTGYKFYPGTEYSLTYNGGTVTLYAIFSSRNIKIYKNGNIASLNFVEGSSQIILDETGSFSANQFIEGKTPSLNSTSIKCAKIIEGEI